MEAIEYGRLGVPEVVTALAALRSAPRHCLRAWIKQHT